MLLSKPLWACVVADFCYLWAIFTSSSSMPQYMADVMQLDIASVMDVSNMRLESPISEEQRDQHHLYATKMTLMLEMFFRRMAFTTPCRAC